MIPLGFKLGKHPPKFSPKMLELRNYVDLAQLPVLPNSQDYFKRGPKHWGMLGNDSVGCCTEAGLAHLSQIQTVNASGVLAPMTEKGVLDAYSRVTGYDPSDPTTDRGGYCLDALNDMRKNGIVDANGKVHKIAAYAKVSARHHAMVRAAVLLGTGLYIGANLHSGIWGADIWNAPEPGETLDGGHAMAVGMIGEYFVPIGWDVKQLATWDWSDAEVDEMYCVISEDQLDGDGLSVPGFNLERLLEDVTHVTS
jgi:hypothetical protein